MKNNTQKIVYLVRHGESLPRENMSNYEGRDVGLSNWGKKEAIATAKWLRPKSLRGVYASTLLRAKETAEEIVRISGLSLRCDERFAEWAPHPDWKGKQFKEAKRKAREDFVWAPEGGESVQSSVERFLEGLNDIAKENVFPVAVVGHALVIQNLLMHLMDTHMPPITPEGSVTTIIQIENGWKVVSVGKQPSLYLHTWNLFRKWGKARGVWN